MQNMVKSLLVCIQILMQYTNQFYLVRCIGSFHVFFYVLFMVLTTLYDINCIKSNSLRFYLYMILLLRSTFNATKLKIDIILHSMLSLFAYSFKILLILYCFGYSHEFESLSPYFPQH